MPVLPVLSDGAGLDGPDANGDSGRLLGAIGQLWAAGVEVDWGAWHSGTDRRRVALPTYPFERARHWIDAPARARRAVKPVNASATAMQLLRETSAPIAAEPTMNPLPAKIAAAILAILSDLSGEDLSKANAGTTFLELAFDWLFLSQVAQQVQRQFRVKVTFRRLLSTEKTVSRLAEFIMAGMPAELAAELNPDPPARVASLPVADFSQPAIPVPAPVLPAAADTPIVQAIVRDQLAAMSNLVSRQLAALQSLGVPAGAVSPIAIPAPMAPAATQLAQPSRSGSGTSPDGVADGDLAGGADQRRRLMRL